MIDSEVIKYLITKFEDKLKKNPLTPDFIRLAYYYLVSGNADTAIELLQAGLKFYPNYVTARLLLGKSMLAGKYFIDAKKVFEQLISENPDMGIARKFLDITNDLTKNEVTKTYDDEIVPKLEFKAPAFNDYEFSYNLFPSYEIEDVTENNEALVAVEESLEFAEFKKVYESSHSFKKEDFAPTFEKKRLKNKFEVKIITETLADIFAKQGNYFDAIEAYTHLLKIKPGRKDILESKISEVEVQINKLINDF